MVYTGICTTSAMYVCMEPNPKEITKSSKSFVVTNSYLSYQKHAKAIVEMAIWETVKRKSSPIVLQFAFVTLAVLIWIRNTSDIVQIMVL